MFAGQREVAWGLFASLGKSQAEHSQRSTPGFAVELQSGHPLWFRQFLSYLILNNPFVK